MAQALTVSTENKYLRAEMEPFKLVLDWVSAADGSVSLGIVATLKAAQSKAPFPSRIKGKIVKVQTIPGLNGDKTTATPTALYDITLLDAYSGDVADGNLMNRSASAAETVIPSAPIPVDGELTLTIANAGDTKKGRIIIWFE